MTGRDHDPLSGVLKKLRSLREHSAGVAHGLDLAIHVIKDAPCDPRDAAESPACADRDSAPPPATERRERTPTMRPVLDVLRRADAPMTPSEIITACRKEGFDLRRDSVKDALNAAVDRGVVEALPNYRYRAARD